MIVAGFGFRREASISSLEEALSFAQVGHPKVTHLATVVHKIEQLRALALKLELILVSVPLEQLAAVETLTHSLASHRAYRVGSIAEAAALAAAGPSAQLASPRHISLDRMATCAIAFGAEK